MLGQLYRPQGLARETAQAVLETKEVYAVNVADGCPNNCLYCFNQKGFWRHGRDPGTVRLPKESPARLVARQIDKMLPATIPASLYKPEDIGVFLSFLTDPYLSVVAAETRALIHTLLSWNIRVATLSKINVSKIRGVRDGMTIVSLDDEFWQKFEPNTVNPETRLMNLDTRKREFHDFIWVSMEPYPPSAIYKQNFEQILQWFKAADVDLIVFGKWNYDARARTEQARAEYAEHVQTLTEFGLKHGIRTYVKSDTLKFIGKK